jgi:hypothetical protein
LAEGPMPFGPAAETGDGAARRRLVEVPQPAVGAGLKPPVPQAGRDLVGRDRRPSFVQGVGALQAGTLMGVMSSLVSAHAATLPLAFSGAEEF